MNEFSRHFNSKLNSLDFINNTHKLMDILNNKVNLSLKHKIILPCKNEDVLKQLVSFKYSDLILDIMKRLKIEEECYDNFLSLMEPNLIELYINCISKMKLATSVEVNYSDISFDIHCPELFMDLIWSPISQFHASITGELDHLSETSSIVKKYHNLTSDKQNSEGNLFINSKVSTPFSYFILAYVAENLNIPLKF